MSDNGPIDHEDDDPSESGHDRLAEPVNVEEPPRLGFPVIGIGASAGGLEAYSDFFKAMPPDSGMAFVLIQHLPPERDSLMAEILSNRTQMPVREVVDGISVEPNHVYVIRPGRTLTIKNGALHLGEPLEKPGHRRAVDDFFRSLAEEQRERAICIVMSGMGSNGTAGARAVKAVGGVCIAQDPDSASFSSMPRSLIDSGLADFVLRPEEIPDFLQRYAQHPYVLGQPAPTMLQRRDQQQLLEIFSVLRTRTRHAFDGYKKPTVLRRIQRRMSLSQVTSLVEYVKLLRQSPNEISSLADDLLIHVTGFFRDPEAWQSLYEKVIVPLVDQRQSDSSIRAWVTACSSGEEAYTLAMLLVEAMEVASKQFDIKIFATDTADRTLAHARAGSYPMGIEGEVTPERLERFFDKDDSNYRVKKELRELVVFAPQNVLQDPPFSRLDICTCRNLLIYLEPEIQRRILSLLHFGLREGGALFLGNAETVADGMFETIDKKWRIYRRIGPTHNGSASLPHPALSSLVEPEKTRAREMPRQSMAQIAQKALLSRFTPPSVVIDRQHRIAFFHGNTDPFLTQPPGEPTRDVLLQCREAIRNAVRTAIHQGMTHNASVVVRDGYIETETGRMRVEVSIAPLDHRLAQGYYLLSFALVRRSEYTGSSAHGDQTAADDDPRQLEEELNRVRDELQNTIEELQTSNEELKASSEESTSINEELQSTNEELETSKEELQSLNEELTTVNTQLQSKMEELEATSADLDSLLSSTDIAVIFLDNHFRIRRFTPAVKDLLELIPSDVGRPLANLARKFDDPELLVNAQTVLDKLVSIEKEMRSDSGHWYVRRVLPHRTADNRIGGVVMTFVDITAQASRT